jgi:hypothetical protein
MLRLRLIEMESTIKAAMLKSSQTILGPRGKAFGEILRYAEKLTPSQFDRRVSEAGRVHRALDAS